MGVCAYRSCACHSLVVSFAKLKVVSALLLPPTQTVKRNARNESESGAQCLAIGKRSDAECEASTSEFNGNGTGEHCCAYICAASRREQRFKDWIERPVFTFYGCASLCL